MLRTSTLALSIALALGLTACGEAPQDAQQEVRDAEAMAEPASTSPAGLTSGIELENLDKTVPPQENFYQYINGQWLAQTEIPSDRARWGSFDELRERAEEQVLAIIEEFAAADGAAGSDEQKIGDLYHSFMAEERLNALGVEPLAADFARIEALSSHAELARYWGEQQEFRTGTPFGLFVSQDQMQSDQYITLMSQSGLGMPDRDYYVADSDDNLALRERYQQMIMDFWDAAGWEQGDVAAETVLAVETRLAEHHWTRVQNRDRRATYNKMTVADLQAEAPGIDWQAILSAAGLGEVAELVIRQPDYFVALADLYDEIALEDWQTYLKFHTVRTAAEYLSKDFANAHFEFYGQALQGLEAPKERQRRAVDVVEQALGFMVGQEYVARHYQEESRERMEEMVSNLKVAFAEAIDELEWMTEDTKAEAHAKLATFNTKIGYPEVWRDYDCLDITADDLLGNLRNSASCEYERNISRLGEEVDSHDWGMTPQTVNAYYRSTMNEIVFPAGILQPPFFNVEADDAVNYGAIGAVIGHEITHGFDDQGRRSDGEGNLRDWWTPADEEQFQERASLMVEQFNAFNPIDDLHIQGELALGENIADLGGLSVALRAYRNSLAGEPAPEIDGFTGEQRFFAGWGQVWRIKFRDEALRRQVIQGPHAPGEYRVLGPLSNMPEFYEAFHVESGDGMYRTDEDRVKIW